MVSDSRVVQGFVLVSSVFSACNIEAVRVAQAQQMKSAHVAKQANKKSWLTASLQVKLTADALLLFLLQFKQSVCSGKWQHDEHLFLHFLTEIVLSQRLVVCCNKCNILVAKQLWTPETGSNSCKCLTAHDVQPSLSKYYCFFYAACDLCDQGYCQPQTVPHPQ